MQYIDASVHDEAEKLNDNTPQTLYFDIHVGHLVRGDLHALPLLLIISTTSGIASRVAKAVIAQRTIASPISRRHFSLR